ncbi:MAG: N-acetylmuramoyl-L-alanine amidase [Hyphomicrobiales bacterium]
MSRTTLKHSWVPSPNFNERKPGTVIDMLVIHYTDMASCQAAVDLLCDPEAQVSCHYAVDLDGSIIQMVEETHRAWHAGASSWCGVDDNNGRSIGIEIQNLGHTGGYQDFPDAQMEQVVALSQDILSRHEIPARNIVAHSDIAPERKQDPGDKFNWEKLHTYGIGHWTPEVPPKSGQFFQSGDEGAPVEALQTMLSVYGYGIEITGSYDEPTHDVVMAFQRHWRQSRVDGVADLSTIETLKTLIDALPDSPFRK